MAENKKKFTNLEIALTIILFILGILPGVIYLCVLLKRKGYMDKADKKIKEDFNKMKEDIKKEEHKEEVK